MKNIIVEKNEGILIVKLNRPKARNAINLEMADELQDVWDNFDRDDSVNIGILTSTSENFCSGADLKDLDALSSRAMVPAGPLGTTRRIPKKPVIAAIPGFCVAGGFELALWADIRICEESTKFGFLERRFGVPLIDGGTQRLPLISGLGNALYLILTGNLIDAREALRMNIVSEIVPDGKSLDRAVEIAKMISSYPQNTVLSDRDAVYSGFSLDKGMMYEERNGFYILKSGVPAVGARAFGEGKGRSGKQLEH
ncbi:MAG: enoyl-CoA hydratase-related protein [Thermoplasmatales archaeon]